MSTFSAIFLKIQMSLSNKFDHHARKMASRAIAAKREKSEVLRHWNPKESDTKSKNIFKEVKESPVNEVTEIPKDVKIKLDKRSRENRSKVLAGVSALNVPREVYRWIQYFTASRGSIPFEELCVLYRVWFKTRNIHLCNLLTLEHIKSNGKVFRSESYKNSFKKKPYGFLRDLQPACTESQFFSLMKFYQTIKESPIICGKTNIFYDIPVYAQQDVRSRDPSYIRHIYDLIQTLKTCVLHDDHWRGCFDSFFDIQLAGPERDNLTRARFVEVVSAVSKFKDQGMDVKTSGVIDVSKDASDYERVLVDHNTLGYDVLPQSPPVCTYCDLKVLVKLYAALCFKRHKFMRVSTPDLHSLVCDLNMFLVVPQGTFTGYAYLDKMIGSFKNNHNVPAQLNGVNGEATNSDDVRRNKNAKKLPTQEVKRRAKQSAKDKVRSLVGSGGYFNDSITPINMTGKGNYLAKMGGKIGKMIDGRRGSRIGKGLGAAASLITGSGNYVTNNTFGAGPKSAFGEYLTDTAGNISGYAFREFLGYAFAPSVAGAFQTTAYSVNPGLSDTFPFLSSIASNYTSYSFDQLIFSFETLSGMATTGAVGNVVLCPDYNSSSDPPINEEDAEMRPNAVSGVIIDKMRCGIECDPAKLGRFPGLFIRCGTIQQNQDIKTFDHCKFYISVYGVNNAVYPVGSKIGKIYAYYKVNLINPKVYDTLGFSNPVDQFISSGTTTTALPYGLALRGPKNIIGGVMSISGDSRYYFPDNYQGLAMVIAAIYGTGLSPVGGNFMNPSATGQITTISNFCNNVATQTFDFRAQAASGTELVSVAMFNVNRALVSGTNYISLTLGASTTRTAANLIVLTFNPLNGQPNTSRFTLPATTLNV